ncbi:MAG: hypothetical protein WC807_22095 [Hyphomicrobium sp.]|jgi:hypothetical protein
MMRYHKAAVISEPEARYIIKHQCDSLNACVVIEHFGQWFDIRRMTEKEVEAFVDDLGWQRSAEVAAGLITPH